jgi:hypothetical protein
MARSGVAKAADDSFGITRLTGIPERSSCRRFSGHSIRLPAVTEHHLPINPVVSFHIQLKVLNRFQEHPTDLAIGTANASELAVINQSDLVLTDFRFGAVPPGADD